MYIVLQWFSTASGAATTACSETFRGPSAGSEVETQNTQAALRQYGPDLFFFVIFHTYGSLWLIPWGSTTTVNGNICKYANDNAEMVRNAILQTAFIYYCKCSMWWGGSVSVHGWLFLYVQFSDYPLILLSQILHLAATSSNVQSEIWFFSCH